MARAKQVPRSVRTPPSSLRSSCSPSNRSLPRRPRHPRPRQPPNSRQQRLLRLRQHRSPLQSPHPNPKHFLKVVFRCILPFMVERVVSPPEVPQTSPLEHSRRQLEALLEVSEAIAQQRDLPALFHDLAARLHSVIEFDFLSLVLHDPARNVMRLHILETHLPSEKPTGMESSIEGNPAGWVWETQQPFVTSDTEQETRFAEFMNRYKAHKVRSLAIVPLTTAQRRLGAMGMGRLVPQGITDTELQFMQRVASQVAVAVDNALNAEASQAYQQQLARERDRFRVLLEVNNVVIRSRELPELFPGIVSTLERVIRHDYTSLALFDPGTKALRIYAFYFPSNQNIFKPDTVVPLEDTPA